MTVKQLELSSKKSYQVEITF